MDQNTLVANDNLDQARSYRLFAGLLSGALGTENNYTGDDASITNPSNQFQIMDPYRGVVTQGRTYNGSVLQPNTTDPAINPMVLLMVAAAAFFLLKH